MPAAIEAVRDAYVAVYRRRVRMPVRLQLPADRHQGVSLFMPSYDPELSRTVLKVVSVYGANPQRGLPAILGVVLLLDAETGRPLALMDAARLTGLRTGAASGVATAALARPEARVLALIGAGAQAPYQAAAVCAVRPIQTIRVYSRTRRKAEALAELLRGAHPGMRCQVCASAAEAVAGADVVCTATTAAEPVLAAADVSSGAHVNAVGSFRPEMRELPAELLARAGRVFVDQREACLEEAGEIIAALRTGHLSEADLVEIGAVLAGEVPGRSDPEEVTVFKSCGLAAQDLYAAARVLVEAKRRGLGTEVEL